MESRAFNTVIPYRFMRYEINLRQGKLGIKMKAQQSESIQKKISLSSSTDSKTPERLQAASSLTIQSFLSAKDEN